MRVDEEAAKTVVLVMALEADDGGRLLSPKQRDEATSLIWAGLPEGGRNLSDRVWVHSFLVPRARRLFEEAAARNPRVHGVLDPHLERGVVTALVLTGALLFGFLVDRIPNADQINLLAAPLGLFILWNWCSIAMALLLPLLSRSPKPSRLVRQALASGSRMLAWRPDAPLWFKRAVRGYYGRWVDVAAPLMRARLALVLHLAAIAIAVGAICSVTWSAWHKEFRVGWASTLCKANCVSTVHRFFFSPTLPFADATGTSPFSKEEIVRMERWQQPDNGEGERWLRLTATLLLVTVIAPRVLLAAFAAWRISRLCSTFSLQLGDPYFQALRTPPERGANKASSSPHTYTSPKSLWQRLCDWLRRMFGRRSAVK